MEQNNREREQLSALMDGELPAEELKQLLATMEHQPQLRAQWSGYHSVRHTLFEKRICTAVGRGGVADRVAAALQQEPVVLAPAATNSKRSRLQRPWIPLALAASLATVTLVLIQQPQLHPGAEPLAQNRIQTEWVEIDGEWVERWVNPLDQQAWMRSYLVRHDENRNSALVSTAPAVATASASHIAKRIVGWQVGWLPDGYREVDALQHEIPAFGGAVTHLVLSNGESVFSVFIEKGVTKEGVSERRMKGEKRPVNLYSHSTLGHRITVLGEVPMEVVRKVALSVEARSG
jgi:hypothetical protein